MTAIVDLGVGTGTTVLVDEEGQNLRYGDFAHSCVKTNRTMIALTKLERLICYVVHGFLYRPVSRYPAVGFGYHALDIGFGTPALDRSQFSLKHGQVKEY